MFAWSGIGIWYNGKGDGNGMVCIKIPGQQAATALKQAQIRAVRVVEPTARARAQRLGAQIDDPQIRPTGCQQQPRQPLGTA